MNRAELFTQIQEKQSFLCVGLDPDLNKLPSHLTKDAEGVYTFCKEIIEATQEFCVAYKPNLAFFEALGLQGWEVFARIADLIPSTHLTIADAKRGDIGNTAKMYAKAFFDELGCDALTVAPYMGHDSVTPFLEWEGKWTVMLGLTSNPGSQDFELHAMADGKPLYQKVIKKGVEWGSPDQLMFVVGATQADYIAQIRQLAPDHFFLVPGVGAQGGDLNAVAQHGMNNHCGLLVNASRSIIYASKEQDFAIAAAREAQKLQTQMATLLSTTLPQ